MKTSVAIGNMLAVWQKKHGYNNDEVAKNLGVHKSSVVGWKAGRSVPTLFTLINMKRKGVGIEGIPGVPSSNLTAAVIRNFCNVNSVALTELCDNAKISFCTLNNFLKGSDVKNIEGLYRVEKYIKNYNEFTVSSVSDAEEGQNKEDEKTMSGKWATTRTEPDASKIDFFEDLIEGNQINDAHDNNIDTPIIEKEKTEEAQENTAAPQANSNVTSFFKKTTLREVLQFAEKFNVLDAEMMTDGGFSVYGFRLIIEEDGNISFRLKTG